MQRERAAEQPCTQGRSQSKFVGLGTSGTWGTAIMVRLPLAYDKPQGNLGKV